MEITIIKADMPLIVEKKYKHSVTMMVIAITRPTLAKTILTATTLSFSYFKKYYYNH